jgi:signal transduction histidine kinase
VTEVHASPAPRIQGLLAGIRWPTVRQVAACLALAAGYYGLAKLGQTLRYTASVSAIWPPVGLGIATLYLFGLNLWPGIFIAELLVNGELHLTNSSIPLASLVGQQAGNMAEVIVGAWLLRRLIGPRAALDRASQVSGLILAVGTATAISATVGTISMLSGGVIDHAEAPTFWRTWLLGDAAGALVVLPLILTWSRDPRSAWNRIRTLEGALLICSVGLLAGVAVSSHAPLTYLIFPALIWAAFRFGPTGVTLSTAVLAVITIGLTAHDLGVFSNQMIDERTLSTQLYILVAALTALFLSAVVRIARDLHDSVSQALFSSVLHTRAAQRMLAEEGGRLSDRLGQALATVGELTKRAQSEMRKFIFEWGPDGIEAGLVAALTHHVSSLPDGCGLRVDVDGPEERVPLARTTETQLYGIGREALANVVKHASASVAQIRIEADATRVSVEIEDNGCGFDPAMVHAGHFGLESMRSRADEIGADLDISSAPGRGTVVRVELPVESNGA